MAYEIKRDATLPAYRVQLKSTDPATGLLVPHDLTGITSALFYMRLSPSSPSKVSDAAMTVVGDATQGWVEYAWVDGDTDTSGLYIVEVKLVYPGTPTKRMKFPSKGYFQCEITDDLDDVE